MIESLRNSGIDIVGDASWGTHFCQFYQTKEDLLDILVPYFKAGLENNEFCMWITSQPLSVEEAKEAIRRVVPDIDVYLEKGQLEIIHYTEWYMKEGFFDSDRVLNGWVEKLNQALANGYDGLRLTGNTFWLEKEDWNNFVDYENEVDVAIGNHQMIALCTYSLDRCNANEIIDVVNTHQFALIKREGKWEQIESYKRKQTEETLRQAYEKLQAQSKELQVQNEELQSKSEKLREVNEALKKSETKYHLLFENMLDGFAYCKMLYDDCEHPVDFIYLDVNRAFERLTDLKGVKGRRVTEVIPGIKELHPEMFEIYSRVALTGQPERFEINLKPLGICFSVSVYSTEREHFVAVFDNITERKRAEQALKRAHETLEEKVKERTAELQEAYNSLKESEERLADSQKIAHIGNWDWNVATNEEYWSDELYHIFGLDPQFDLNHKTFLNCIHPNDLDYVNNAINDALNGKPYYINYRIILPDGEERTIYSEGVVIFDEKNTHVRMRGIVQDITERKKAEETLTNIETARKKEIHHRIKNNLQVISSLLDLQADTFNNRENIKDSEVLEAFRESQDRVISMALIHEELYRGKELDKLNFSPYIEELANTLFQTYRLGNTDISLNMNLEENLFFDMDTAVPLGIIVNELVSNSLKHAFPDRKKGEIQIKLHREKTTELEIEDYESTIFTLIISDNGIGIPDNLDIEDLDSLGMQLVTSLIDQLDGELELKRGNGTEFTIRFS